MGGDRGLGDRAPTFNTSLFFLNIEIEPKSCNNELPQIARQQSLPALPQGRGLFIMDG